MSRYHNNGFNKINLIDENDTKDLKRLEREIFYLNNPDYKDTEDIIDNDLDTLKKPIKQFGYKSKQEFKKNKSHKRLQKLWANGGPVKLLPLSADSAFHITFRNCEHLGYDGLKDMLRKYGSLLSIRELDNNYLRARFENEEDARSCYRDLMLNDNYDVDVVVDTKEYWLRQGITNNKKGRHSFYGNDYDTSYLSNEKQDMLNEGGADVTKLGFKITEPPLKLNNDNNKKPDPVVKSKRILVGTWKGHKVISEVEY